MKNKNVKQNRIVVQRLMAIRKETDAQSSFWITAYSNLDKSSFLITQLFGTKETDILRKTVSGRGFQLEATGDLAAVLLA
jgi:hypothetical protein